MVTQELKSIMKEKVVYNVNTGATEILECLRINNTNHYNSTMGDVDHEGRLRVSYGLDRWLCNRK